MLGKLAPSYSHSPGLDFMQIMTVIKVSYKRLIIRYAEVPHIPEPINTATQYQTKSPLTDKDWGVQNDNAKCQVSFFHVKNSFMTRLCRIKNLLEENFDIAHSGGGVGTHQTQGQYKTKRTGKKNQLLFRQWVYGPHFPLMLAIKMSIISGKASIAIIKRYKVKGFIRTHPKPG